MDDKLKQLREKAEKLLNENRSQKNDIPITEFNKVVHDLKVYQIELELQNEELRATQKQHEDSRNKYVQLFNQAPAGYVTLNQKSIVLQANQTFAKMVNRDLDQIVNSSFANFIETSDRPIFLSRFNAFFKNPAEKNMELKIEKKGGKSFFVKISGNLITDDAFENKQGLLQPKLFLIITDITREIIAEKRLIESENNLRSFADSGQALIYTTDTDKLRNYFNKVWLNFTGHTEEMELGEGWVSGIYPDDYERTNQIFNTSFDNRLTYSLEYRLKRHDGEYRWLRDDGCPRYNSIGLFIGYIGYCLDITDSKKIEIELRKSREKSEELSRELEAILDHIPGLVYYKDKLNNFIRVNKFLADAYHKQKSEFEGLSLNKMYPVDIANQYYQDDLAVINSGIPKLNYEENWDTATGMKWLSTSKIPFVDHKGEIKGVIGIATDITERKKTEEALHKSELMLLEAGRLARLGGWEIDLLTNKLTWTEETYHIHEVPTGIKPRIEDGINFYSPEAQPIIKEAIEQAINKGKPFDLELPFITKKGNHLWVRSIGNVDRQNGKASRIYGVFQDITERKKVEEELLKANAYLENLINYANATIIVWDSQFHITRFNHAFELISGRKEADVLGKSLDILFPPEHADKTMQLIHKTLLGERWETVEIEIIHIDRSRKILLWNSATLFNNESGKPVATIAQGQDITERKKAEIALNETNAYLENLLNYANAPIIVWDSKFQITRFNHAFELISGRTEADVLGRSLEILFPPEHAERSMQLIRKTLQGERWETVEIDIIHLNYTIKTLLWNSATLYTPDGKTPIATIAQGQDVTKLKQLIKELNIKNEELQKLNAQKDRFFSIIAHDLKGPFSNILGLSDILCEKMQENDYLEVNLISELILNSSKKTMNLLMNLLEWSSSQSGRIQFAPEYIQISNLIHECVELFSETAKYKSISINTILSHNALVYVDKAMISAVLRNLISNALKFSQREGNIEVLVEVKNHELFVRVKDEGVGIEKEDLTKLFKIEESFTTKGTQNETGTGLGLILCKDFVEKHGGKIWAESVIGKGSTFCFSFPLNNSL